MEQKKGLGEEEMGRTTGPARPDDGDEFLAVASARKIVQRRRSEVQKIQKEQEKAKKFLEELDAIRADLGSNFITFVFNEGTALIRDISKDKFFVKNKESDAVEITADRYYEVLIQLSNQEIVEIK